MNKAMTRTGLVIVGLVAAGLSGYLVLQGWTTAAVPAGVIAAFCELGALSVALTARRSTVPTSEKTPSAEDRTPEPALPSAPAVYSVYAPNAHNIMSGASNTAHFNYSRPR